MALKNIAKIVNMLIAAAEISAVAAGCGGRADRPASIRIDAGTQIYSTADCKKTLPIDGFKEECLKFYEVCREGTSWYEGKSTEDCVKKTYADGGCGCD